MFTRRGCIFLLFGLGGAAILAAGVFLFLNNATQRRIERLQTLNSPPDVYITAPENGAAATPGSFELAQVVAVGPNAIARIELWWDGVKLDEAVNENADLDSGFTATFPVQVTEGAHMIVARVVDVNGIIGQSLPLGIYGNPELAGVASRSFVYPEEGQTFEGLAETFSVTVADLQAINPSLSGNNLSPTDQVILPPSPANSAQEIPPPSSPASDVVILSPDVPMLQVDPGSLTPNNLVLFSAGDDQDKPVKAPTGLQVEVRDCKVLMSWTDNSNNELGYSVWMSDFIRPGRVIANLQPSPTTGQAWFQFDVPPPGPYGFWVMAANWLGAQQSEIVWFRVDNHNCPSQVARDLEFEVVLLDIFGAWDRAYCYVSLEGFSDQRIPPRKDTFFYNSSAAQPSPPKKNLFSIPPDRELNLQGECWKWAGSNLTKLGDIHEAIPEALWDGQIHGITVGIGHNIFYTIKPLGDLKTIGQYAYSDSTITPPDSLTEKAAELSIPPVDPRFNHQRFLSWRWNGADTINGFTVYVNGVALKHVGPSERRVLINLPTRCGDTIRYEVAATRGKSESQRAPLTIQQQPCPIIAEVEFVELRLTGADDDFDPLFNPSSFGVGCSSYLDAYFTLSASFNSKMVKREYYNANSPLIPALPCGTYDFPILVVGSPLHRYPPPPNKVTISGFLDGGTTNTAKVGVGISMYDEDDFGDDLIVSFFNHFVDSIDNWGTYDKTEVIWFNNHPDASGNVTIRITGQQMQP